MASACVNNIGVPPETFIDCPPPAALMAYGWLSTSREYADGDSKPRLTTVAEASKDVADFEFRLDDDPVTMLPADELFSDGKLVPLQLTAVRPAAAAKSCLGSEVGSARGGDPCLFSPKAPRCSSRWRDLLGLKKRDQNSNKATSSSSSSPTNNSGKSIRQFLLRNTKSLPEAGSDASLNLPLLKDSDYESLSVSSSRLSLSSSSSGHEYDDLHRLSLDSDSKNSQSHIPLPRNGPGHPRIRMVKPRMIPGSVTENPKPLIDHPYARASRSSIRRAQQDPAASTTGISADSPRMSSSGKIVFQSLERSSSSPSSLNGGQRYKHRGMERSYSAHVRVTPVLNVPVCSLRGASNGVFGLFSKKEGNSCANSKGHQHNHNHHHQQRTGRVKRGTVGRDGEG